MKNETLEKLCSYHIWADTILQDIVKTLSDAEFTCEIGPPFKSVKALCVHIVIAIEYNIESLIRKVDVNGEKLYEELERLSKAELIAKWEEADKKLFKYVSQSSEEPIVFPNLASGGNLHVDAADFYLQYILHTAYHRGQLVTLLKMMGKESVTTDYLYYLFHLEEQRTQKR